MPQQGQQAAALTQDSRSSEISKLSKNFRPNPEEGGQGAKVLSSAAQTDYKAMRKTCLKFCYCTLHENSIKHFSADRQPWNSEHFFRAGYPGFVFRSSASDAPPRGWPQANPAGLPFGSPAAQSVEEAAIAGGGPALDAAPRLAGHISLTFLSASQTGCSRGSPDAASIRASLRGTLSRSA